jgi:CcmD family protein
MKNFANLFTAWIVVWAVFFIYELSIGRRLNRLREEIARLKDQIGHS